jgi:hypothetical protein
MLSGWQRVTSVFFLHPFLGYLILVQSLFVSAKDISKLHSFREFQRAAFS